MNELMNVIPPRCIQLFRSVSKDIYNVTYNYFSIKCCSFELSINL